MNYQKRKAKAMNNEIEKSAEELIEDARIEVMALLEDGVLIGCADKITLALDAFEKQTLEQSKD